MRALASTTLGLALAACSSAPPPPPPALDLAPILAFDPTKFPGAAAVLTGFAPVDDDPSMRAGDAALLGFEVHRDGAVERQLVLLEVARIPWEPAQGVKINGVPQPDNAGVFFRPSRTFTVTSTRTDNQPGTAPTVEERLHRIRPLDMRLHRLDAAGQTLRTTKATLYEEPLATGFWPYARNDAKPTATDLALALTVSLQDLATNDAVLQDLLFCIVERPSLWSIATNFGVAVTMKWSAVALGEPSIAVPGFPAEVRRASLELVVNGTTAAWVTLLAAEPTASTRACGGLVGAIAQHPTETGRFAVVRLLATRRGAPAMTSPAKQPAK